MGQVKTFMVQDLDVRRLINEINKIGVSINQISKNNYSGNYQEMDKEKLNSIGLPNCINDLAKPF